ncbi:MAG: preprotein translocase subunit YajC [Lachnospiraceae bacterium]|nr:preprotein translocase subunit YajC [Lachnospiraceae bacterium]
MEMGIMVVYIVALIGLMYFITVRPQKKEQKRMEALLSSLEIGDSVCTTAGFYGVVIGMDEDMVIVEFGSNKNCRIPMKKTSIVEVEKA